MAKRKRHDFKSSFQKAMITKNDLLRLLGMTQVLKVLSAKVELHIE